MIRRAVIPALVIVVWLGVTAAPSHAVVHEIVGQWCSGQGELEPPGIADPTARNFAQPLEAMGLVGEPVVRADLGGLLIPFNFDEPASKVVGTGTFIQIGALPDGTPLFIEQIALDPDHPAFQHCPRLFTPQLRTRPRTGKPTGEGDTERRGSTGRGPQVIAHARDLRPRGSTSNAAASSAMVTDHSTA